MHKKLEAELVSLAHSILQMKNKDDVSTLHKKSQEICEKLSVLKFVNSYMSSKSNFSENTEKIVDKNDEVILVEEVKEEIAESIVTAEEVKEEIVNDTEAVEEVEKSITFSETQTEEKVHIEDAIVTADKIETPLQQHSLEDELKDAISADTATEIFEKVTKEDPIIREASENNQRSLNDTLFKSNLQVGLNDRIAFVKYLFEGNQEDFNRVVSQLNSFKTEDEAKKFINNMVKPDYDWSESEEYELRLTSLIERRFS